MKRRSPPVADSRRLYKVFVSSTFLDNQERRKLVQDAITMAGMVWHGMEIFTASTRPTVEECLRYAKEADLLVGIIARRYGWEPDGNQSITEMEYDAAQDRLMFLIDPELPVNTEKDFDPGPERWKKQEKLEAFKARIRSDQTPAVFTETTLQAKVLATLNDWRSRREPKPPQEPEETTGHSTHEVDEDLEEEIRQYRQKADSLHATLPVAGFVTQLKVPIDIEDIYVPLHAVLDLRGVDGECFADAVQAEDVLRKCDAALEIALPEAFRQCAERKRRGVVILGDPGAGKTTHLKRLLLGCLRKGAASMGLPNDMLPVFLPLRDLRDLEHGLDRFIQDQLASPHLQTPPGFGERLLKRSNLLFLLDGLDEVADPSQRKRVTDWIKEGLRLHSTCWFVVTSRFAGYTPDVHLGADFLEMHIRPLSEEQVAGFVNNWYRIVERGLAKDLDQAEGIAREKAEQLINKLREPDFRTRRVFELTRNPLLLTNICLVHRHRGALPKKRARLYEECIDVLLEHWQSAKKLSMEVTAQESRRVLQPAALWLHSEPERTRATAKELAPHIEPVLKSVGWNRGSAAEFLRTIRDQSGLLTGWGVDQYGFMHLGFQEYLAAREIRSRSFEDQAVLRELARHYGESWWQEVTLLLLALEDPSLFVPFMREVVRQPAFVNSPAMVEMCLDDAAEVGAQPFMELVEADPGKEKEHWQRQLLALKVLERLDADRVEALKAKLAKHPFEELRQWMRKRAKQAVQEIIYAKRGGYELVRIPGGAFMMGSPPSEEGCFKYEGPVHEVRVPEFCMGRYPLTNEEYGRFLKENPQIKPPKYWADRRFNQPRQPVVGVDWEDAQLYASWAGLRLPSEAEWEYACRAGTSSRYYTGDTEKNLEQAGWYIENSGGQTHPVGGKTPNAWGLYDMHGNVWEWVEDDWHRSYEGAPADGRVWGDNPRGTRRVLRGGGWGFDARLCRSAVRSGSEPDDHRDYNVGFRLSRSVALGP
jgi:formylglycine-generating enzyme required for sulfatase activity